MVLPVFYRTPKKFSGTIWLDIFFLNLYMASWTISNITKLLRSVHSSNSGFLCIADFNSCLPSHGFHESLCTVPLTSSVPLLSSLVFHKTWIFKFMISVMTLPVRLQIKRSCNNAYLKHVGSFYYDAQIKIICSLHESHRFMVWMVGKHSSYKHVEQVVSMQYLKVMPFLDILSKWQTLNSHFQQKVILII